MDPVIKGAISIALGYILGGILPGYFLAKVRGFDIRKAGSGNPGVSNVAQTMGYPTAIMAGLYDVSKAPLAIFLAKALGNVWLISYFAGLAALIGHLAPFYLRFQGGEGMSTAVGIVFWSSGMLLQINGQYAYAFILVLAVLIPVFLLRMYRGAAEVIEFALLPILVNAGILLCGLNIHSIMLLVACLYLIGHRIVKLMLAVIPDMSAEESKLLWRKWLRPLAIVFPLGALYYRQYTLFLLLAVFICFVVFEIIRFLTKYKRFPVPYRKTEESRISSMVIFLFAALLVLWFFPIGIATLAIMFVVFGDLMAWCIGITIRGRRFLDKTWSGMAACFVTCFTLAAIYSSLGLVALPVGLLGAISATAVEAAPLQEDNFVMPVASVIVMAIV
ncbi:MAG: glycerol-3-phosphate acyltransferase [Fidelibacterota bacterium]|nr:MAG: glycerol-3-phosphate acyltransferase [Candidatus Neomarinimicrobiota bacterium]